MINFFKFLNDEYVFTRNKFNAYDFDIDKITKIVHKKNGLYPNMHFFDNPYTDTFKCESIDVYDLESEKCMATIIYKKTNLAVYKDDLVCEVFVCSQKPFTNAENITSLINCFIDEMLKQGYEKEKILIGDSVGLIGKYYEQNERLTILSKNYKIKY